MSVDDVKNRLREGGETVARGHVRVDSSKALLKLRYRLGWSAKYVLDLVRSAVAAGARNLWIRIDADDVELEHDGAGVSPEALRELFVHALGEDDGRDDAALWYLANGVNCGMAFKPRWLIVESGAARARVGSGTIELEEAPPRPHTRFHLKHTVGKALRRLVGAKDEIAWIRRYARRAALAITLNGVPLEKSSAWPEVLVSRQWVEEDLHMFAGLTIEPQVHASVTLAVHGVAVVERGFAELSPHLVAHVRHDGLQLDAARDDVVTDTPAYRHVIGRLRAAADDLLEEALTRLATDRGPVTSIAIAANGAETSSRARRLVWRAKLLPGPAGEWYAPAEVRVAGAAVRIVDHALPAGSYDPPVVLVSPPSRALALLPEGPRLDVTDEVRARARREANRIRFESQPDVEPVLAAGDDVATADLESRGIRGQVAFPRQARASIVRFLSRGKLLGEEEVKALEPLRLRAVIDSPHLGPTAGYDGVAHDEAYDVALVLVRKAARRALLDRLAEAPGDPTVLAHAGDLLRAVVAAGDPVPDALRAAPLFPLAGGGMMSIAQLAELDVVRCIAKPWASPALDGKPVVILDAAGQILVGGLVQRRPVDFSERLRHELRLRERLQQPKLAARLTDRALASVLFDDPRLTGEIGIPWTPERADGIQTRLMKGGVTIVDKTFASRYAHVIAVVDCEGLEPNDDWNDVVKNGALANVVGRLKDHEARLAAALVEKMPAIPLDQLPAHGRTFLLAYLRLDLGSIAARASADGPARVVLEAPLFRTLDGPLISLAALAALEGDLPCLDPGVWDRPQVPPGMTVIAADAPIRAMLEQVLGRPCRDAREEIPRLRRRQEFASRPVRPAKIDAPGVIKVTLGGMGELAHRPGGPPGAEVEVLWNGRLLMNVPIEGALSTAGIIDLKRDDVDPGVPELSRTFGKKLEKMVRAAEIALAQRAAANLQAPGARRLLLEMFASAADLELDEAASAGARHVKLIPTVGGEGATMDALGFGEQRIKYTTQPIPGAVASAEPIVVADDPIVKALLWARWPTRLTDVTAELGAAAEARRRVAALPVVAALTVAGEALWRQPLEGAPGIEGEIALGDFPPHVRLHIERREVATHALPVPPGVAAAVNCDRLRPSVQGTDVVRDKAYEDVIAEVLGALEDLAMNVALRWPAFDDDDGGERARLAAALAPVCGWLVERDRAAHLAVALPLLESSDGRPLSYRELGELAARDGCVRVASRGGSLFGGAPVWRPRPAERELAGRLRWRLEQADAQLAAADESRARPRVESLAAPVASPWREPVTGDGIEGEIVILGRPTGAIAVELIQEGRLLERLEGAHAVGLTGRVRCDRIRPAPDGQRAVRDEVFKQVIAAVDAALERLLGRILAEPGERTAAYARAAVRWGRALAGPVAEALAAAPLFRDATGAPVTVGRARAEAAEHGRVAAVPPGTPVPSDRPPRLVLAVGPDEQTLLDDLQIPVQIVAAEAQLVLRRAGELAEARTAIERSAHGAVAQVTIDEAGWRGQLFLPAMPPPESAIVFARGGAAVDALRGDNLGVLGVLEKPAAVLEADGLGWRVSHDERTRGWALADRLLAALADGAPDLSDRQRPVAAVYALRWLLARKVSARDLDGAGPVGTKLAAAKLFRGASSRWLDLRSIADHAVRHGAIDILPEGTREAVSTELLGSRGAHPDWLGPLTVLLGGTAVRLHASLADWRLQRRDAEPDAGSPLYHGLELLRAEAETLRAGAFSRLGPSELARIKLRRAGGKVPVIYDERLAIAMLDPEHPGVAAALAEARQRPDRIYVLLAGVFGVVNRWLERVTDEDEATACGALVDHLAANPAALQPGRDP